MKIGYARVSTQEQNLDRQIDILKQENCERIYEEKVSGAKNERPELEKMIDQIRADDIIIITDLTRLGRNFRDLFKIADRIKEKGAQIKSLKESWVDTTTAQGEFMFTMFAGLSQFERDIISQRTKEALKAARARGRKGGRPKRNDKSVNLALTMYNSMNHSIADIIKATGISKTTLYRRIHEQEKELSKPTQNLQV